MKKVGDQFTVETGFSETGEAINETFEVIEIREGTIISDKVLN